MNMPPVTAGVPHAGPSGKRRVAVRRRGFTLAEIIVAIVITGFLAGASTIAISQTVRARDASVARVEAHLRAETAVSRIATDVENLVRDPEVFFTRLLLTNRTGGDGEQDELLMYMRSLKLVRPRGEQGEGGEYECQYRLEPALSNGAVSARPLFALWRRADPVPDEIPDGGGVAAAFVTGITSLSIKAYDSQSWLETWDSDSSGYPHAVSITAVAVDDSAKYTATARRIIALDRTPLPEVPVVIEEEEGSTSTGSGQQP